MGFRNLTLLTRLISSCAMQSNTLSLPFQKKAKVALCKVYYSRTQPELFQLWQEQ